MQDRHLSTARATSILLAAFLAGCFHDGGSGGNSESNSSTPSPPSSCLGPGWACKADPNSSDARYIAEEYLLTQITNDSRSEETPQVEGDLVIWQVAGTNTSTGEDFSQIYVYNLSSKRLIGIAADFANYSILPRLDGGRVIYYNDSPPHHGGIHLWDSRNSQTTRLNPPIPGYARPDGFEGDWVTVRNRGSSNDTENAWWAWNIKDDRLVYLYKPFPENRRPDGSYETLTFTAIDNGVAYYPLTFADPTSKHFNATLVAVNLTTEERREYHLPGNSLYRLSVNDGFAVSDPGLDIVALNLTNGTFWYVNGPDELGCGFPTTAKGLVSYTCDKVPGGDNEFKAILLNLTNGQRTRLFLQNLPIFEAATDGSTWLLEASRGAHRPDDIQRVAEVYDFYYTDLYWMKVPR